ncbi:hypothetical protein PG990_007609 [Apiospora arundinis]
MVDLDWESKKPESEKHDNPGMSMSPLGTASTLIAAFSWDKELESTFYERGSTIDTIARYFSDYTGGPLTSFLFGTHLLETGLGTGLTATVLKNPPRWNSVTQYLAEYVLMYDRKLIESHFNVKLSRTTPEGYEVAMYPLMPYYKWERVAAPSKSMEFGDLMPQPQLAKWLHAHFLKICLPYKRGRAIDLVDEVHEYQVKAPSFFHRESGYVPHFMLVFWNQKKLDAPSMADIRPLLLDNETGNTTTSARYVRREVVRVLTTFKWATDPRTATFWLRRGDMEVMVREDWLLYVWRTDFWDRQSGGVSLKSAEVTSRPFKRDM